MDELSLIVGLLGGAGISCFAWLAWLYGIAKPDTIILEMRIIYLEAMQRSLLREDN